jgi:hypothetical protein
MIRKEARTRSRRQPATPLRVIPDRGSRRGTRCDESRVPPLFSARPRWSSDRCLLLSAREAVAGWRTVWQERRHILLVVRRGGRLAGFRDKSGMVGDWSCVTSALGDRSGTEASHQSYLVIDGCVLTQCQNVRAGELDVRRPSAPIRRCRVSARDPHAGRVADSGGRSRDTFQVPEQHRHYRQQKRHDHRASHYTLFYQSESHRCCARRRTLTTGEEIVDPGYPSRTSTDRRAKARCQTARRFIASPLRTTMSC